MPRPAASTSWERVSNWYATHLKQEDFLQRDVVIPRTLDLLRVAGPGAHLDIACGEGGFAAAFQRTHRRSFFGIDASPTLIRTAQAKRLPACTFQVADAQQLENLVGAPFASATCILAMQNIEHPQQVFEGAFRLLKTGAPFVIVMNHPCFRQPRQSGWGWDEERKIQFRRVDRYLEAYDMEIIAHPGQRSSPSTTSYHRPLSFYINELAAAGFVIDALEEWTSPAVSDSGPRAKAENISRREIPLFLTIRGRKLD